MYCIGDRVIHSIFGFGTITDVIKRSIHYVDLLLIKFDTGDIKQFPSDSGKILKSK